MAVRQKQTVVAPYSTKTMPAIFRFRGGGTLTWVTEVIYGKGNVERSEVEEVEVWREISMRRAYTVVRDSKCTCYNLVHRVATLSSCANLYSTCLEGSQQTRGVSDLRCVNH